MHETNSSRFQSFSATDTYMLSGDISISLVTLIKLLILSFWYLKTNTQLLLSTVEKYIVGITVYPGIAQHELQLSFNNNCVLEKTGIKYYCGYLSEPPSTLKLAFKNTDLKAQHNIYMGRLAPN